MAEFDFPETPTGTLSDLWRAVVRLLPQLGGRGSVVRNASIGTGETPVAHGLKFATSFGIPVFTENVAVWETQRPDSRYGYFAASTATVVHVRFIP